MLTFMWGLTIAWVMCTWYFYSQNADETNVKGAFVIGTLFLLIALCLAAAYVVGNTAVQPSPTLTPTIGGR